MGPPKKIFTQLIEWYHRAQLVVLIFFFLKTPNGVLLLPYQYCSGQILKMSMRPKVLRKLYPGIGTLHNDSDLVDLRDLNG